MECGGPYGSSQTASSAAVQLGWAAKKSSSFPRLIRLLNMARPFPSAPCAWKTCLAISRPIVITSDTDASLKWCSTLHFGTSMPSAGRPPHHKRPRVCFSAQTGKHSLVLSLTAFDQYCDKKVPCLPVVLSTSMHVVLGAARAQHQHCPLSPMRCSNGATGVHHAARRRRWITACCARTASDDAGDRFLSSHIAGS